ncbi:MAG: hypothetical protein ACRCW0_01615 [Clostridium sp.]
MKIKTKEIVTLALLAAIMFLGKISLSFLPNVEIVSLLTIIYTIVFKGEAIIITIVFIALDGMLNGIQLWWITYLFVWPLLVCLTLIFKNIIKENFILWAIFSAIFGLCFGLLSSIPYIFINDLSFAIAYFIRGIPYDLVHMLGNYFTMMFLGKRIYELIRKLK